jgi:hypothetical protein
MDASSGYSGTSGFNAYGIPFQLVIVPQAGITLPQLNSSSTTGNYGGLLILDEVSYDYGGTIGWQSAITTDQWNQLYAYQVAFGVRMVRINVYPTPDFGEFTELIYPPFNPPNSIKGVQTQIASTGCCGNTVEQAMYFTDVSDFPTAGLLT